MARLIAIIALVLVFVLVLCVATAQARADPALFGNALVLGTNELDTLVTVEVGTYPKVPFAVALDLWVGLSPRWTVGVIDSDEATDRIGAGDGLCLDRGCGIGIHGAGLEARWSWRSDALAIVPRVRLIAREVEPFEPAATIGAIVRWGAGPFTVTTDPYIRIGSPAVVLPVWFELAPSSGCAVALHTGWGSSLPVMAGDWHVPLAVDLRVHASSSLELLVEAGFTSFAGPADSRIQRVVSGGVSSRW